MSFFVYIIYSKSLDKFYVGYTSDLEKKLVEHNTGISDFTSRSSDWEMKYTQSFPDRQLAMKREKEIKKKKSRRYLEWIITQQTKS